MSSAPPQPGSAGPPPFAIGAALLLWGWHTQVLFWAALMAVGLEAARGFRWRLAIDEDDFNRLWNLTILLFVGGAVYVFLAQEGLTTLREIVGSETPAGRLEGLREFSHTALKLVQGWPLVFFPFVLAHAWSLTPALPWSVFSLYLRRMQQGIRSGPPALPSLRVHPGHLYGVLVLLASSTTDVDPVRFGGAFMVILGWLLWPVRSRRYAPAAWAFLLVGVLVLGLAGQRGFSHLRDAWQHVENRLLQRGGNDQFDPHRSMTALGSVGRLKQSGRLVLRVRTEDGTAPPLLREAVYNRFRGAAWSTVEREFQQVEPAIPGALWWLGPVRRGPHTLTVQRLTDRGSVPLALPTHTIALRDLPVLAVETNRLGAARLIGGTTLVGYTVEYDATGGFDPVPQPEDLGLDALPDPELRALEEVADTLGLTVRSPAEAVRVVEDHFARGFRYSLWQPPRGNTAPPLRTFLLESRAGHCEYFATATVLLLRRAGVPARYAVGYAAAERRGSDWIARSRHAHAWTLAWVNEAWVEIDTTPGGWSEFDAAGTPWWEGLRDAFAEARYRFLLWRQQGGEWQVYALAGVFVSLGVLGWRQLRGSRWKRARALEIGRGSRHPIPGGDSEFYGVLARLEARHGPRPPAETPGAWIRRLSPAVIVSAPRFQEMVRLHYRLRFDPEGPAPGERQRLRDLAGDWLATNR